MDSDPLAVILVLALITGGVVALRLRAWLNRATSQKRFSRGRAGEQQAAELLRQEGYKVVDKQASREASMWVDGRRLAVRVRADYLVQRNGKKYVVEVKTGKKATDPTSTSTRRQLLEYERVYDADGMLLADMEQKRLLQIWFEDIPVRRIRFIRAPVRWIYVGFVVLLVGMSMGAVLHRILTAANF